MPETILPTVCPSCRARLEPVDATALHCLGDATLYRKRGGIWRFLEPARREELRGFLERYRAVRRDEGWGSREPAYYRALPFRDLSGRHPEIWRIRAISYRALKRHVLDRAEGPLRILDVGAGNGWLSYRSSLEGHACTAVDLDDDERDGLGALRHYPAPIAAVQADMDGLPWDDGELDLVVFNGALHYSRDYARTLAEAARLLGAAGRIVVMDSPIYRREASGEQMLRELDAELGERYALPRQQRCEEYRHEGYLTLGRLRRLGEELGLEWRVVRPFYGLRWALLPWKARLLGRREPMRFHLLVARRNEDGDKGSS